MILTARNDIIPDIPDKPSPLVPGEELWNVYRAHFPRQGPNNQETNSEESDNSQNTKKSLEYLFISIAILILGAMIYRRLLIRAKRNQMRTMGRYRSDSPNYFVPRGARITVFDPYDTQAYPPRWGAIPAAHINPHGQTMRRTRAEDIDAGGRRIGDQNAELDHGQLGDKDALPAYDMNGGPPRYIDVQPPSFPMPVFAAQPDATSPGIPDTTPPTVSAQQGQQATPTHDHDPHLFPLPRQNDNPR